MREVGQNSRPLLLVKNITSLGCLQAASPLVSDDISFPMPQRHRDTEFLFFHREMKGVVAQSHDAAGCRRREY